MIVNIQQSLGIQISLVGGACSYGINEKRVR